MFFISLLFSNGRLPICVINFLSIRTVLIINQQSSVKFIFPNQFDYNSIAGTIHFYRPSDPAEDFIVKISPDTLRSQIVSTDKFIKGAWKVKVDWEANGKSFYNEKILMVN